jgi:hypothetical protein
VTVSSAAETSKTEKAALEAEALAKLPGTTGGQTCRVRIPIEPARL